MKAKTKNNILYVVPVLLLIPACIWASSSPGIKATLTPLPLASSTGAVRPAPDQNIRPSAVAGSFADFRVFAAEITTGLDDRNPAFLDEYLAPSRWNCLGDEPQGICKDIPAGTTLEGIPVTHDWADYKVYSKESYQETWRRAFAGPGTLKPVAIANQLGDNPLMPMAGQSFLAIVGVAEDTDPSSVREVRVLFFEHYEGTWHLAGELDSVEHVDSWVQDTCSTCYDRWEAWPQ